ncbi:MULTISPECIES: AraC family transcriptional regulator [unclassified Rhizobium]|jgi:AraC-like DNA-binding protein|uniref:helix-turn-helix transcriptional regulator n=1 Tax=unclassified Rhizobium TaxID=2613769 RepID=UPI00161977CA|nr:MULTISPECIES: AraC family transcriptional regulator [unclassified Rhizobium]MBB3541771.1 AraC-like DNA-binding protein [Rhizobium sp. BK399]MCS3740649.1 AraC-like DNA-binding protein [Rhizobium sp. BK661]MCS4092515.1 AraC-like DNA-binding protein [Rhizobium sp. BK176]
MMDGPIALYRSPSSDRTAIAVAGFGRQRIGTRIINRRLLMHAVVLVEAGRGTLQTVKAGIQEINGPSLFWLPAGTLHSYGPAQNESWEERWALFEGTLMADLIGQRLISITAPLVRLHNVREMQHLFGALHSDFAAGDPLGLASAAATLHRIAIQGARQANTRRDDGGELKLELVIETLQRRAFEPIDMHSLAQEFGVSPATLRRRFHTALGLSPKAFQLRLRIDRAKQLLATSDLSIEAVSHAIGIDDAFYFSRLFQDREHCSPSEFRRQHRRL